MGVGVGVGVTVGVGSGVGEGGIGVAVPITVGVNNGGAGVAVTATDMAGVEEETSDIGVTNAAPGVATGASLRTSVGVGSTGVVVFSGIPVTRNAPAVNKSAPITSAIIGPNHADGTPHPMAMFLRDCQTCSMLGWHLLDWRYVGPAACRNIIRRSARLCDIIPMKGNDRQIPTVP